MTSVTEAGVKDIHDNCEKSIGGGYTARERIGYIDAIKGFAILCVVLGHIADGYLNGNSFHQSNYILYCIYNIIYAFHMPLFIMISGFVYCAAYFDENDAPKQSRIHRQVLNLTAVYIFFSVAFGLFKVACGRFVNSEVTINDVLMIWAKPISPYWYLYTLIVLYLIFSTKKLCLSKERICVFVLLCIALCSQFIDFEYFQLTSVMYYSVFFYIGMMYKRKGGLKDKRLIALLFAVSAVLLAVFWKSAYKAGISIAGFPVVGLFVAAGIVFAIWFVFERTGFLSNNFLLRFCGRYSLEIYVIHCIFTAGFRVIFPKIGITNMYVSIILNLIISTAIPILFSMACKKLKIHGLLFKPVTYIMNLMEHKSRIG